MALYWSFLLPSFVCLAFTCFNQCFLKAAVQAGGEITLTGDVEVREPLTVTGNTVIDLCGYELKYVGEEKGDGTYMLLADGSGTSLTVTDSGDGGTILNDVSAMESLLRVTNNATLNIDGGTLVNTLGQRAVSALSGGRVNMTGGVLTGVQAGSSGAGILVIEAALSMTGGKITGNSCTNNGGAIRIVRGTVTIAGSAEISNNTAIVLAAVFRQPAGRWLLRAMRTFSTTAREAPAAELM